MKWSGAWPFHDKTDWYYSWGSTISWQNRLMLYIGFEHFINYKTHWYYVWGFTISWQKILTLCLRLAHFMTKHTYGFYHFMTKKHCYYVWGLTISWQTDWCIVWGLTISWSNTLRPRYSIRSFCHEMVKPQTWYLFVLSWNGQSPDIVTRRFIMKWSNLRHSVSVFGHEMVPFHDKTNRYHVWGLTISWQKERMLYLGLDHLMTKQTDTMSGAWPFHDQTDW
jgi:hypothetical protein